MTDVSDQLLVGFGLFAVVTLFTPGPNNLMLMSSGLNHGLKRAQPHVWGVTIGFATMVLIVGLGLGAVFARYPAIYAVIKYVGVAYLLYLAWHILRSGPAKSGEGPARRPISFIEAAAFQWVNPKAWVMAVGAISTYAAISFYPANVAIMAGVFALLGILSSLLWVSFGTGLRRFVTDPHSVRIFNAVMAGLVVASIIPVLFEG